METDNKELKEETTKKEADERNGARGNKQPVEETAVQKKEQKWIRIAAVVAVILLAYVWQFTTSLIS